MPCGVGAAAASTSGVSPAFASVDVQDGGAAAQVEKAVCEAVALVEEADGEVADRLEASAACLLEAARLSDSGVPVGGSVSSRRRVSFSSCGGGARSRQFFFTN